MKYEKKVIQVHDPVKRWARHLKAVLNHNDPNNPVKTAEAKEDLPIRPTYTQINTEDIVKTVKVMNTGKAPAIGNLNGELFKMER